MCVAAPCAAFDNLMKEGLAMTLKSPETGFGSFDDDINWRFDRAYNTNPLTHMIPLVAPHLVVPLDALLERELAVASQLCDLACASPPSELVVTQALERVKRERNFFLGYDHFVPADLDRRRLLAACQKAGIGLKDGSPESADHEGWECPTEVGVFTCDLATFMEPTNARHSPYKLPSERQRNWASAQGGDGICSVEEYLLLLLHAWLRGIKVPIVGGAVRCNNSWEGGHLLTVFCDKDANLGIYPVADVCDAWYLGAVPRRFIALGD